jgi:murein DD-endopeptidase MepM/ murein hydrolase activator NlpD
MKRYLCDKRFFKLMLSFVIFYALLMLSACADRRDSGPAPYEDGRYSKNNYGFVTVQKGDSVSKIAMMHKVKIRDLILSNDLKAPYNLYVGQKLILPGSAPGDHTSPFQIHVNSLDPKVKSGIQVERLKKTDSGDLDNGSAVIAPDVPASGTGSSDVVGAPDVIPGGADSLVLQKNPVAAETKPESELLDSVDDPVIPVPDIPLKNADKISTSTKESKNNEAKPKVVKPDNQTSTSKPESKPAADEKGKKEEPVKTAISFRWPAHGDIVKPFKKGKHFGINIAAPEGSPVFASEDGVVAYVGDTLQGLGNLIVIKHRNGWMTAYAHTKDVAVKREMKVKKGQEIAKVGQTGNVNVPQLHFEIRKKTQPVDPKPLLE